MNSQNILITGISGQDGLFLTDYLLSNNLSNFKVFGVSRQNSEATLRNLKTLNNERGRSNRLHNPNKYLSSLHFL